MKTDLIDFHNRTHEGLITYLEHCRALTTEQFLQPLEGFGIPSLQQQFNHVIGAEQYWSSVIRGEYRHEEFDASEDERDQMTIEGLLGWRSEVAAATVAMLQQASTDWLATPALFMAWPGKERELQPRHVMMRIITHNFQHRGQIAAMCRLHGHPVPQGLDFPLGPDPALD
ncbi:DinB family protein [bacterium]|nr:DinB family protein [bacterium]